MRKSKFFSFVNRLSLVIIFLAITAAFAATSYVAFKSHDINVDLNKVLLNDSGSIAKAFFSPDTDIQSILISLINSEKESISLAIYCFTQKETANALVKAYKRGIKIQVVSDREYAVNRSSKIPHISNHRIPVWVLQNDSNLMYTPLMHNKFVIFGKNFNDKPVLWTGSYNFTQGANLRNQENVVILDNPEIIESFKKQFNTLKERSLQISGLKAYPKPQKQTNNGLLIECREYLNDFLHIIGLR